MHALGLRARAQAPVDIASLAAFRALFGGVLCVFVVRYVLLGWVHSQLIAPDFHFTYPGFDFVRPWSGGWLYVHFGVLALSALGTALGLCYRACAITFTLGFAYAELIDRATYLNHYYLVTLLAVLLALLPAGAAFSLDVRRDRTRRRDSIPAWVLWALRTQVGVVYVYAGVAKLNADWLLSAQPLRIWLATHEQLPVLGPVLSTPEAAWAFSWAGAVFDLSVAAGLLHPRTRPLAFGAVVAFHSLTGLLFPIGLFPWLMVVSATLFFSPEWPRRWYAALRRAAAPAQPELAAPAAIAPWRGRVIALHCVFQLGFPLVQHLRSPDAAWTYDGFNFVWKVMVAEKAGRVVFEARDRESGERLRIEPSVYLSPAQEHAMAQDPALILALARHIGRDLKQRDGRDVAVHAEAFASLNGRPAARLIDPSVDLTRPLPAHWIAPAPR